MSAAKPFHNPLPSVNFTFRDLPWRWRLRRSVSDLCPIDLLKFGFTFDTTMFLTAQHEVDKDLDQVIWEGGHVFARIRSLLNGYGQSSAKKDVVKAVILSAALNHTFAGHAKSLDNIPKWKTYAARVSYAAQVSTVQANKTELVLFEAESDEMAMELVLEALLKMEDLQADHPDYMWNLVALFYKKDGRYYLPPVDVDLTKVFWDWAHSLISHPTT